MKRRPDKRESSKEGVGYFTGESEDKRVSRTVILCGTVALPKRQNRDASGARLRVSLLSQRKETGIRHREKKGEGM